MILYYDCPKVSKPVLQRDPGLVNKAREVGVRLEKFEGEREDIVMRSSMRRRTRRSARRRMRRQMRRCVVYT
jgi:hypothetical protein